MIRTRHVRYSAKNKSRETLDTVKRKRGLTLPKSVGARGHGLLEPPHPPSTPGVSLAVGLYREPATPKPRPMVTGASVA